MEERWLPCADEDISNYEVSDKGCVRNPKTGRVLKTYTNDRGYEVVNVNGKNKRIHKLVAKTFIEEDKDDEDLHVTHKDKNRSNNHANNLEYKTRSEIIKDTYLNGREQTHRMRPIRCVETGEIYPSIKECARRTGLNRDSICKCVNNPATKVKDGRHFEPIE